MKISNIEKKDGICYVTKTPNLIQKLFGKKLIIERYRSDGNVFHYFPQLKVFYKSTGELIGPTHKMCKILNDYENSF